ncbi:MAG: 6-phosphofructokinase, partial [Chloroflexales bacterium]|nr:6-phosphofructokinase [Chloroflexales bacterium]
LYRITEAIDSISSTAASHQRTFVVEVMGRSCGYLALMGAISGGADWVLIPESPPSVDQWEEQMCSVLKAGREAGRRDSIVIVAEGARDWHGNPISAEYVKQVLEERLGEDTRVTILGHVQRGGMPSAFDRYMSTLLGHAAVEELLLTTGDSEPQLIGLRNNRITRSPLMRCVEQTHAVADVIAAKEYDKAMELRGGSFKDALQTLHILTRVLPSASAANGNRCRLLVLNAGGLSPGMNTAVRIAVRLGMDQGHTMLAARNGFRGLIGGSIIEQKWMSVSGWASRGGAELGTSRKIPRGKDLYAIARNLEEHQVQGILMIGGWAGYQAAYQLYTERHNFPAFNIPIVCLPATINNNLPGSELSIGSDTALNNIVRAVDNIKQSAVASGRCFVVEVMGRDCGYLSLMGGLASGAERVYLPEEGVTLDDLREDLAHMMASFKRGKRLSLMIRNENANPIYTTGFMCSLFEEEGRDLFSVRQAILGHLQQGGDPSPFDRIQATRLTAKCIDFLINEADNPAPMGAFIGLQSGKITFTNIEDLPRMVDEAKQRPRVQWWMDLRRIARTLSRPRYDD